MPPPPSFIDIVAPFPVSRVVTQAEFNGGTFGGVINQVWFRFVTAVPIVFGGVTNKGGTFIPLTQIYASDGSTILFTVDISGHFRSWHFYLLAGTYYVKVTRQAGGASNFDFTSTFDTRPILTSVTPGNLIINDDIEGFPAIVMGVDGTTIGFLPEIPSGEIADALPTGEQLWQDRFGLEALHKISVFNNTPSYIGSVDTTPAIGALWFPRITQNGTQFYIINTNDQVVFTVSKLGVVSGSPIATVTNLANNSVVGVNKEGTILYYGDQTGATAGVIRRWDLVNDIALSNLYAIPGYNTTNDTMARSAEGQPGEILVLTDGTVITWYYRRSDNKAVILLISTTGTLINSFAYDYDTRAIDHIHYFTDENHIRVWFFTDVFLRRGKYAEVLLADGSITGSFDTDLFSAGIGLLDDSTNIWGPAESCMMVTYKYEVTPPAPPPNPGSGIYKLVPGKHNDTLWNDDLTSSFDVKIP